MQNFRILAAAGALALLASSGAFAQDAFRGQAKLATPVSAPIRTTVNGVTWACEGDTCVGEAAHYSTLDNPVRECKRVAASLGALTAYAARGREVTGGGLKACNSEAAPKAGAATAKP